MATKRTTSKQVKSVKKKASAAAARVSASAEQMADRAKQVGRRVSEVVQDAPEFVQAKRNERALRAEMDDHCRTIGKRVVALSKRARGESPFARFQAISREVDAFARVEEEYRSNRERLGQLRAELRGRR